MATHPRCNSLHPHHPERRRRRHSRTLAPSGPRTPWYRDPGAAIDVRPQRRRTQHDAAEGQRLLRAPRVLRMLNCRFAASTEHAHRHDRKRQSVSLARCCVQVKVPSRARARETVDSLYSYTNPALNRMLTCARGRSCSEGVAGPGCPDAAGVQWPRAQHGYKK